MNDKEQQPGEPKTFFKCEPITTTKDGIVLDPNRYMMVNIIAGDTVMHITGTRPPSMQPKGFTPGSLAISVSSYPDKKNDLVLMTAGEEIYFMLNKQLVTVENAEKMHAENSSLQDWRRAITDGPNAIQEETKQRLRESDFFKKQQESLHTIHRAEIEEIYSELKKLEVLVNKSQDKVIKKLTQELIKHTSPNPVNPGKS